MATAHPSGTGLDARVVVVGGGIAALACVSALRSGGHTGPLTIIDPDGMPYDRPPLSKEYLSGAMDAAGLLLQQPDWYAQEHVSVRHASARDLILRPERLAVALDDGKAVEGDVVVLATGGTAAVPPLPGVHDPGVHVLRTRADADRLRAALVPDARLLVVGAGLIGAEAAATALALGCAVTVVDPVDPPLAAAVGEELAAWLHAEHDRHGATARTDTVTALATGDSGLRATFASGVVAEFDAVLLAVGMRPATALAEAAGLDVARGILVDDAQRTSDRRVLAIGDCAERAGQGHTEHWEAAQVSGRRAATTILGADATAEASSSWWWSDRHGRHVEAVGEPTTPGAISAVRGGPEPPIAHFVIVPEGDRQRLIGAVAIDDPIAIRVARRLIDRGHLVDADELTDPSTNLRTLLRR
jgi:NADPH-dependent 2,4-dienoyl-CoA reductase/sulfur reductase-like enzyme